MHRPSPRRGFTLVELLIVIFIIGFLAVIATPTGCGRYRGRANQRACFANQKTIAGAVEMYNLDFNTNVTTLTSSLRKELEDQGYLQQYPRDPGGAGEYVLSPLLGNGIYCTEHGPIQGRVPDSWDALRRGTLEQSLPGLREAGLDWLLRDLRRSAAKEVRRAQFQGALIGAILALGTPIAAYLLYLGLVVPIRRVWGATPEAPPLPPARSVGILHILSTRGLADPWPQAAPDGAASCPVCAGGFHDDATSAESCPSCLAPHHPECREFNQGCGIYACGQR